MVEVEDITNILGVLAGVEGSRMAEAEGVEAEGCRVVEGSRAVEAEGSRVVRWRAVGWWRWRAVGRGWRTVCTCCTDEPGLLII